VDVFLSLPHEAPVPVAQAADERLAS
jgi:hypothetical protein